MTRIVILAAISICTVVLVLFLEPISQNLAYHRFIDVRSFAGIPNFLNVYSNLPFILVGVAGLQLFGRDKSNQPTLSWKIFFFGVFLVGFGSAYYHLNPNNATLVWDRLPMTIGFMGLFVALLSEWFSKKLSILLIPMCLLGIYSVYYWHQTDDLRLYAFQIDVTLGYNCMRRSCTVLQVSSAFKGLACIPVAVSLLTFICNVDMCLMYRRCLKLSTCNVNNHR